MNDVKFYLKASRSDKKERAPIHLVFRYSGKQFVFPTSERCRPDQWDAERMRFKRSMPGYQEANEGLELLIDKLRKCYRNTTNAGRPVTNQLLKEALVGRSDVAQRVDLVNQFAAYIAARKNELKASTLKSMNNSLNRLKRYAESVGGLRIDHYTNEIHADLCAAMLEDMSPVSVGVVSKHLNTFFSYCREVLDIQLHPRHATIKKETAQPDRIYLTEVDLSKLETTALPTHLDRVRDAFLFQTYTGLRYADLWRLQHRHIEPREGYRVLVLITEKSVSRSGSVKRVEIPLLPGAERILSRYDTGQFRLLPVLSNQKYNEALKEIALMAGLTEHVDTITYVKGVPLITSTEKWKLVSSHIARHTFATLSLIKGVPLEVVSKTLGHSNLHTTMIYAKVADEWKNQQILKSWSV